MIHHDNGSGGRRHESSTPPSGTPGALSILFENDAWLGDLFDELERRGVPFDAVRTDDAAVLLDGTPAAALAFNRVSPSSYIRGHGPAIAYAEAYLDILASHGRRIINGPVAFRYETSKIAQHLLFRRLGVAAPRTMLFNNKRQAAAAALDFPFPAIVKPNCGGSGAYVRRIEDHEHLLALLESDPDLFAPDHLLLLQELLVPYDGAIVRTEFIDGEFVYAMRVRSTNTFNLCPAESCDRFAADPARPEAPQVEFEPYLDLAHDAIAQAREIVRAAHLDVGGVEFIVAADGSRRFFDINATSVYRPDICDAFGVDAVGKLVDFIARERDKELHKRSHHAPPVAGRADDGAFIGRG